MAIEQQHDINGTEMPANEKGSQVIHETIDIFFNDIHTAPGSIWMR
jgi:hypothetical protein